MNINTLKSTLNCNPQGLWFDVFADQHSASFLIQLTDGHVTAEKLISTSVLSRITADQVHDIGQWLIGKFREAQNGGPIEEILFEAGLIHSIRVEGE